MSFLTVPDRTVRRFAPLDGAFALLSLGVAVAVVGPWSLLFPDRSTPQIAMLAIAVLTVLSAAVARLVLVVSVRTALATTAAAAGAVAVVTTIGAEGSRAVIPLLGSIVNGVPRALTTRLPLGTVSDTFGAVAILVWIVAATVTLVIIERRSTPVVIGVVAAGHAAALASVAGGLDGTETFAGARIAALIVGVLIYAGLKGVIESGHLARRSVIARSISGGGVIALVILLVLVLAVRPQTRSVPSTLRYELPPRVEIAPDPVPLIQVLRLGAPDTDPDRMIARVRVETAPDDRWNGHLVVARFGSSDYVLGGQRWRTVDAFLPTGGVDPLREVTPSGGTERALSLEVALEPGETLGGWLPHPRPLDRIERIAAAANGQGLIVADPTTCSDGCTYVVRGTAPSIRAEFAPGIRSTSSPAEVAEVIGDRLTGRPFPAPVAGQGIARPSRQVCEALEPNLARHGISCDEPADVASLLSVGLRAVQERGLVSGTTGAIAPLASSERLSDVLELLRTTDGSAVADPIQFATAYALLLQHFQIDASLTVGLRAPACTETVAGRRVLTEDCGVGSLVELRARDAWAWVELQLDGIGWIVLDPSPAEGETERPDAEAQSREDRTPPAPERGRAASLLVTEPELLDETTTDRDSSAIIRWLLLGMVAVGAVLLPGVTVRSVRLRARRSGAPEELAVASLHELVEALHDAGVRDLRGRTTREVVELAAVLATHDAREGSGGQPERSSERRTAFGLWTAPSPVSVPLLPIQRAADMVICSGRGITAAEADQAWELSRAWSRRVRRSADLRRRARALVTPPPSRLSR
jgi:hypothetical protein